MTCLGAWTSLWRHFQGIYCIYSSNFQEGTRVPMQLSKSMWWACRTWCSSVFGGVSDISKEGACKMIAFVEIFRGTFPNAKHRYISQKRFLRDFNQTSCPFNMRMVPICRRDQPGHRDCGQGNSAKGTARTK